MKKIVCLFSVGVLLLSNLSFGNSMLISSDKKVFAESEYLKEDINQDGTTVLVVTHNREIVNAMEKRVITMKKGVVISDEEKGGYIDED